MEVWGEEGVREAPREGRSVLVDDADRSVVDFCGVSHGAGIDREGKREDQQREDHVVALQAAKLFGAEPEDGRQSIHGQRSCLRKASTLKNVNAGMNARSSTRSVARSSKCRPLVNAPTLRWL